MTKFATMSRRSLLTALPAAGVAQVLPAPTFAEMEDNPEPNPILSLPFVRDTTRSERAAGLPSRLFWSVEPLGDYTADCETGAHYARLALDYMTKDNFSPLLGWAVFDMMRAGPEHSGIEVGFLSGFGQLAILGHCLRTGTV